MNMKTRNEPIPLTLTACLLSSCLALVACADKDEKVNEANPLARSEKKQEAPLVADSGSGRCSIFPQDSAWNTDISQLPVHPRSDAFIQSIGAGTGLHADFGSGEYEGAPMGIPYVIVDGKQPKFPVTFVDWPEESDPGPYPIPLDAPIEGTPAGEKPVGDGDHHAIAVDLDNCRLYELYHAFPRDGGWEASNGAVFDLNSRAVPPRIGDAASKIGWTSADAAGLPIFPGLVRYDEVKKGEINHALRFTVSRTQKAFVFPATHWASKDTNPDRPPMGLRVRLKADFDISGFSRDNQVILRALKKYGMILADNGSNWYLSGAPDPEWDNDDLRKLQSLIKGRNFEAVDTGLIRTRY